MQVLVDQDLHGGECRMKQYGTGQIQYPVQYNNSTVQENEAVAEDVRG